LQIQIMETIETTTDVAFTAETPECFWTTFNIPDGPGLWGVLQAQLLFVVGIAANCSAQGAVAFGALQRNSVRV
jgi:hypothetical protein